MQTEIKTQHQVDAHQLVERKNKQPKKKNQTNYPRVFVIEIYKRERENINKMSNLF